MYPHSSQNGLTGFGGSACPTLSVNTNINPFMCRIVAFEIFPGVFPHPLETVKNLVTAIG